jgi:hypothetical protein
MNELNKYKLIITALKESLAQKVADYEEQIASIRAEATMLIQEQGEKVAELESKLSEFEENEDVAVSEED